MKITVIVFVFTFLGLTTSIAKGLDSQRWKINELGGITWNVSSYDHFDHIEMSGLQVSTVVRYGVKADGSFYLERGMVWPLLRTAPDHTHASLMRKFREDIISNILVNHHSLKGEKTQEVSIKGMLKVKSVFNGGVKIERVLFPSVSLPVFCEKYTITNASNRAMSVEVPSSNSIYNTDPNRGVKGSYKLFIKQKGGTYTLKPNESVSFQVTIEGYNSEQTPFDVDVAKELKERQKLLDQLSSNLILETPSNVLNTMFDFAKIRASESIYKTEGGLMHGPGGESFYAAIWANDQAEYINPFFPFLGYDIGNESALNSFKHFARFMNDEYKPIPSSIISEGRDIWNGAGDRGDAAMIAHGAARYALVRGCPKEAAELWPLIEWCLEYCRLKLNKEGVVMSDSDELEGRFPAGDANLCTSSLYYDALISALHLAKELKKPNKISNNYKKQAGEIRKAIEQYFGGEVEGYQTYKYYKENEILRSWICIPLSVGIAERKDATIEALFSKRLWTENGLLTQAGSTTFWDRSTLYALRGVLTVGETDRAMDYLKHYSSTRLLGEHVPYAIEAWPERDQKHLSAESGLYCRIFIEGLFGIRPIGLNKFEITPRLPKDWEYMNIRKMKAFSGDIDILIKRIDSKKIEVSIFNKTEKVLSKKISLGETISITLN